MIWSKTDTYVDVTHLYAERQWNATMCQSLCNLFGSFLQSQGMALPDMLKAGAYQDFLESIFERDHYFGMLVQKEVNGRRIRLVGTIAAEIEISDGAIPVATCFALQVVDTAQKDAQLSQGRKRYMFHRLLLHALRLEQYQSSVTTKAVGLRMAGENMPRMYFFDAERQRFRSE